MTLGTMIFARTAMRAQPLRTSASRFIGQQFSARWFSALPNHTPIIMPALSPTMEEGVIANWQKNEGDEIIAGDILCEIETDKATVDFEMLDDGYLAKILSPAQSGSLKVGSVIGVMVEDEGDISAFANVSAEELTGEAPKQKEASPTPTPPTPAAPTPAPSTPAAPVTPVTPAPPSGTRVIASPLAKKLAREQGLDLAALSGTGPNGRIIKADIDEYVPSAQVTQETVAPQAAQDLALTTSTYASQDASLLEESKRTIPHYYLNVLVNVDQLLNVRTELNKSVSSEVSLDDFIVRAAALAMRKFPEVNSSWHDGFVREYKNCDVNLSVISDYGVVRPVIRNVDRLGLAEIGNTSSELIEKVKSDSLSSEDMGTGTFTISNFGEYGVTFSTSIVYPHQAASLTVGKIERQLQPNLSAEEGDSKLKVQTTMPVTLSCDHRVVDGAVSAQWLQEFRNLLENPMTMLL